MAILYDEIPESRSITMDPPTVTTRWVCEGVFDEGTSLGYALTGTPQTWAHPRGVLHRQDIKVDSRGNKLQYWTVPYAQRRKESGEYRIDFSTMGGTVHIVAGDHVEVFPSGKPTHEGLIGVKGDDVEGVDRIIPAMKIVVHFKHPTGVITQPHIRLLSRVTGSVDNAGFLGWDAYETLFLGCDGSEGTDIETETSYHFLMSENRTSFSIGGITGIDKKGHDVAWVAWQEATESGKAAPKAEYVNIVRVYRELNLSQYLGFGA